MNYTRRDFLKTIGAGAAVMTVPGCSGNTSKLSSRTSAGKPNIILIMSDDMGFSDIGCYGSEINTPNLDHLAEKGLRFTQFYNTARCCPTRASLMTGLYQHQAGVGHMTGDYGRPGYRGDLNNQCVTIAQVLKSAGYSTYMSGKWHVTPYKPEGGSKHNWPLQRGFGRFFGTIHGAGSFFDPNSLTLDNRHIPPWKDFYYTDAISDFAVRYIKEHRTENPFFMYVAYTAAHWPMHAWEKDIAKYKGRYDEGWDELRKERHARLKKMGLVDPEWQLTPRDERVPAWQDEPMKDWQRQRMEVYATMVDSMDQGIGRIIRELRKKGQLDNTLIFFLQDNGGCAEDHGSRGSIKPDPSKPVELKPMAPRELQTRMVPKYTRDGKPVRTGKGVMPGPPDTYIAYGKGWANASNTPFRLYKHWVHEGGISTPLITHWPNVIRQNGELSHQPGHLIDIMATCCDVAGAQYPKEFNGNEITPLEGKSLLPILMGGKRQDHDGIFWEHEGNRAVRKGKWKLVSTHKGDWELYDMVADRTEMNNLSGKYPKIVEELTNMYDTWAKRCHVEPWDQVRNKKK
jgi:arylsulfatase A-like enzyme